MAETPKALDPAEKLRWHYQAVSGLVAVGADEPTIGAALVAAEAAGLVRTALQQAVHEGALDRERRAEVAAALDRYRSLIDTRPPLPGLNPPELTGQPGRHHGPKGGRLR